MKQADDFRAESKALENLLAGLEEADFQRPTSFKGWTFGDIIRHLHVWNRAAWMALTDEEALASFFRRALPAVDALALPPFEKQYLNGLAGKDVYGAWREFYPQLADAFLGVDPKTRLRWAGPAMSARSSITARLMETWAHGQAIYDALGVARVCTDAIENIVVLGVNTYEWSFKNRNLRPPYPRPHVELRAPSGAVWRFGDKDAPDRVEGEAVEFCQVVTQTRHVSDTALTITGPNAAAWMNIAQCFAGPPVNPPKPGSRRMNRSGPAIQI